MTEENTQEQTQEQAQAQSQEPFPVAENPDAVAPEVTPAGNPDEASETLGDVQAEAPAEAPPEEGVAVTMIEDEDGTVHPHSVDDTPSSIQLQPGDPTVPKPEHLSDLKPTGPELSASQAAKVVGEMNAGAARVKEHEEREALLAAKRDNPEPEEVQVAAATEANKDL